MQGRWGSSVRRFAAKLAGRRQARVRCAGIQRAVQDEVQPSDRGPEHDAGSQPHVPVPEQEPQDGRENLGRLRGTSQIHVCKHNISAAKHETRDRCGATWTCLSSPCPSWRTSRSPCWDMMTKCRQTTPPTGQRSSRSGAPRQARQAQSVLRVRDLTFANMTQSQGNVFG